MPDFEEDDAPLPNTIETPAPTSSDTAETEKLGLRRKLTLKAPAPSIVKPDEEPEPDLTATQGILDPTRRRETDTTSLKRIRPSGGVGAAADGDGEDATETIHLKVIREKKSQLKNILSSSQTIRLRPSSSDDGDSPAAPTAAPAPSPAAATVQSPAVPAAPEKSKKTLKIKAPDVHETKTANLGKTLTAVQRGGGGAETEQAAAAPRSLSSPKSTLKIKAPPAAAQTQQAAPAPAPTAAAPSAAAAGQKKATLKIKAPSAVQTQQAEPPPAAAPSQTVKQQAPKAGKTLKLKAGGAKTGAPTMKAPAAQPAAAPESGGATQAAPAGSVPEAAPKGAQPGILYTIGAVASLLVCGGVLYFTITQYMAMWPSS